MLTVFLAVPSAQAAEVTVYNGSATTYCVDDESIAYTNLPSDIAFKAKVVSYQKTYSPQSQWYFFEEEEDGTIACVIGEGSQAKTVKRADEPAYSVYKFCVKHLYANEPLQNPDKAVLAYAETYGYGSTKHAKEAGVLQSDVAEVRQIIINKLRDSFQEFCLSDESLNKLANIYLSKLQNSMDVSAKTKIWDAEQPVVTVSAKILDDASFEKQAANDPNLQGITFALVGLKNEGKTEADLKADATVQLTVVDCIAKFIYGLDFGSPKSIDIVCAKNKAADGKIYWAPQKTDELYRFMTADYPNGK